MLLKGLEKFLADSFEDAIVWDQKDADLSGKYVYIKYEGADLGVFMGYYGETTVATTCVTFFFAHPSASTEARKDIWRIFHRVLIRLNLRMKDNPYRFVAGKSPAIMRTRRFGNGTFSREKAELFFAESVKVIKKCEPVYRAAESR